MTKEKSIGFELAALETIESVEHEVMTLTGQETGIIITIASPYSEAVSNIEKTNARKMRAFLASIGNPRQLNAKQLQEQSELAKQLVEDKVVAATLKWRTEIKDQDGKVTETFDHVVLNGEQLVFGSENVRKVYVTLPALKEQIAGVLNNEANFSKR